MIIKDSFKKVKKEEKLQTSNNEFVNSALKDKRLNTRTDNGMKAFSTTGSALVNLFATAGNSTGGQIELFEKAYSEDPIVALKLALFIRDIREGLGRRLTFREIVTYITSKPLDIDEIHILNFISKIPELGRWDDLFYVDNKYFDYVIEVIKKGLENSDTQGLCAKWMPRQGNLANALRKALGYATPKEYRKKIVELSNTVEQKMCERKWDSIKYNTVPSIAFKKYTNAFMRHDENRFSSFLNRVKEGKETVNAGAIYPYQVIDNLDNNVSAAEAQWKNLPDFIPEDSQVLVICDDSGSMESGIGQGTTALNVAHSLAIYTSERLKSAFKNLFMTFSETPRWMDLSKCKTLNSKVIYCRRHSEVANTDIVAAFKLILNTATINKVKAEDMPKTLLILSDMEFDYCVDWDTSALNIVKKLYLEAGYELPNIIFWNLNSHTHQFPVEFNDKGVALMNGFSPTLLKYLKHKDITPYNIMMEVLNNERYNI